MPKSIFLVAFLIIAATGFFAFRSTGNPDGTASIKYEVSCKQCAINFRNEKGDPDQVIDIKGEWEYYFTAKQGQFLYVSATNDDGSKTVVTIVQNGKVTAQGSSEEAQKSARAGVIL